MRFMFLFRRRTLSKSKKRIRKLCIERLADRIAMTAEGQSYGLDQTLDVSELVGDLSSTIAWGDGTSSPGTIASKPAAGPLKVRIDYSFDSTGFFQSAALRTLLQSVVDGIASRFSDTLSAIQPQGTDRWEAKFKNPITGVDTTRVNMSIAANEIVVFVGSRAIGSGQAALGDRGGFSVSSSRSTFINAVKARGQAGALASPQTDLGPWGGAIAFDTGTNWYTGADINGIAANQLDFVSVASHEFLHVLGFGTTESWNTKIVNSRFAGPFATQEYGAAVPLANAQHFANNILYRSRRPMMVPGLGNGERLLPSRLDLAAMSDIGWQLITPSARITGSKVYGDNGNFPTAITLNGSRLGSKSIPLNVAITNAVPTFVDRSSATATAGQRVTLARMGQFTDPGFGAPLALPPKTESFTYRIEWGDNSVDDTGNATIEALGSATALTKGYFDGAHTYANAGTYTAKLTVTDDDGGSAQQQFQILVNPKPVLVATINKATFSEAAGAGIALLTIERPAAYSSGSLVVQLRSSDTSEATLPTIATFLAGATSVIVGVNAIDDALFDGSQSATLSASADGYDAGSVTVTITDYQPVALAPVSSNLNEDIPAQRSTRVTVSIRSPAPTGGVPVALSANPSGVLTFPVSVTIPAGSTQTTFDVSVINDERPQRERSVALLASGTNLVSGSTQFTVTDTDPYRWTNPAVRFDVNDDRSVDPLDALTVINEINRTGSRSLDPVRDVSPPYWDANPDGFIDPLDVLAIINEINRRK